MSLPRLGCSVADPPVRPPGDCLLQTLLVNGGLYTPGQAQAAENPTAPPAASGDWGSGWGRDDRRRQKGDRYVLLLTTRSLCRSLSSWSGWCSPPRSKNWAAITWRVVTVALEDKYWVRACDHGRGSIRSS